MIHEPTYWSADCDLWGCKEEWQPYDYSGHEDEEDIQQSMREDGWIVLLGDVFCSLDHLLTYRAEPSRRSFQSDMARIHSGRHRNGRYCCHGAHATNHPNGVGHEYSCPQYRVAVRAKAASRV